jgi:hypothetical protein
MMIKLSAVKMAGVRHCGENYDYFFLPFPLWKDGCIENNLNFSMSVVPH